MAHETGNIKVRSMVMIAIVSAITLGVLDLVFKSYFNMMIGDEEEAKVLSAPTTQLDELRKAERQRLTGASLPIDRAMQELGTHARDDQALKDVSKTDITPQPSNDLAPLTGWAQLAKPAAKGETTVGTVSADAGAPTPSATGDAGAAENAGDAGAAPTTAPSADAGAKPTTTAAADAGAKPTTAADAGAKPTTAPAPNPAPAPSGAAPEHGH